MVDVQSKNQKPSYTTTFLVVKLELDYQQTRSAALSLWQKGMDKTSQKRIYIPGVLRKVIYKTQQCIE